jgi:hypothetical protein
MLILWQHYKTFLQYKSFWQKVKHIELLRVYSFFSLLANGCIVNLLMTNTVSETWSGMPSKHPDHVSDTF